MENDDNPWERWDRYVEEKDGQLPPLHEAVEAGDLKRVQALLDAGADIEERHVDFDDYEDDPCDYDEYDEGDMPTPLYLAASRGHVAVARYLVERGAKIAAVSYDGRSSLHVAAEKGHRDVVRLLFEHGADKDAKSIYDWSPLGTACLFGHVDVVEYLLEQGCDMETVSLNDFTSLRAAATHGCLEITQLLLRYGARLDVRDQNGRTAADLAVRYGHAAVAEYLLERGCDFDVDKADAAGDTALHHAARENVPKLAQLLFRLGAKLDLRNNLGQTPADLATARGHHDVANAIRAEEIRRRDHGFKRDRSTIEGTEEHAASKRPRAEREADEAAAAAAAAMPDESDDDDDDDDDDDEA